MRTKQAWRFKYLILLTSFGAFLLNASTGYSGDDMEAYFSMSPAELADIPVAIATGTPKPIFRSPGSISVVTEDQIKTMGATELHEVIETIPGIHVSLDPTSQNPVYSVRGLANEKNSQMLVLMNGTRISTPLNGTVDFGPSFPLAAVQRVEVIRGPGSAVYGADAFAGVINIITKKAADIKGGQLGVRAGNWNTQSGWGQYGNRWGEWDIATNIQYQGTDGDSGRIISRDNQSQFDQFFKSDASHAPAAMDTDFKSINTHVSLQRKHWDIGFWANNILNSGMRAGSGGSLDPEGHAEGAQYLGDIRFSTEDWFDDWEIQAHLSYLNSDVKANAHIFPDNARLPVSPEGNIDLKNNNPGSRLIRFSDGAIDDITYTQRIPAIELISIFRGFNNHQIRLSTAFRYEDIIVDRHLTNYGKGVIENPDPEVPVTGKLTDVTNTELAFIKNTHRTIWSAVLQDEWQIADSLELTAGVRYDHYSDFGDTLNPRAALAWQINKELTGKLMYGRAFRAPTFYEQALQNNPSILSNFNLKPETIDMVELAFDYRPASNFRTAVNIFYYALEDLIIQDKQDNPTGIEQYKNTGKQEGYGAELEWNWQIDKQWNLAGSYSWQNSQKDLANRRGLGESEEIGGVPEHQVYAALRWNFLPQWQFQTQLNWIGGRLGKDKSDPFDSFKLPLDDYESVDFTLRGNKLWGHVNFAASLRNAFDDNNYELARLPNYPSNYPLPGRSFYLEASVDF